MYNPKCQAWSGCRKATKDFAVEPICDEQLPQFLRGEIAPAEGARIETATLLVDGANEQEPISTQHTAALTNKFLGVR
jgi:hypothetical protein